MTPRFALVELDRAAKRPRGIYSNSFWGRHGLAAILAIGMAAAGSTTLSAQDVPPPPPDDQSSQPQQYPQQQQQYPQQGGDQQLPQYGSPADGSQQGPPQGAYDQQGQPDQYGQQQMPPQVGQPMSPDQLNQLVAPIALYPDALVAQILAGSTYPAQIADADHWRQAQGNASPDQIANAANAQQWDPSVKALTAFPTVLSQMDHNMQWTTDLGNAYYNQPQDVMNAVQQMRERAQSAGTLESNQQQTISDDGGDIEIAPANPDVVYVPAYDPWAVYGPSIIAYPGYYYAPPPGFFVGVGYGWGVRFGIGIPLRPWAPWGWGWHNWGFGWHNRTLIYNRNTYITRSNTVINRGFYRPGAPPRELAGSRGSYMNRPGYAGYANRAGQGARPGNFANRPAYNNNNGGFRPGTQPGAFNNGNRPGYDNNRIAQPGNNGYNNRTVQPGGFDNNRQPYNPGQNYNRPNNGGAQQYRPSAPQNNNRPQQNYNRPAPAPRAAPAPRMSAPAPHVSAPRGGEGGGGGEHRR